MSAEWKYVHFLVGFDFLTSQVNGGIETSLMKVRSAISDNASNAKATTRLIKEAKARHMKRVKDAAEMNIDDVDINIREDVALYRNMTPAQRKYIEEMHEVHCSGHALHLESEAGQKGEAKFTKLLMSMHLAVKIISRFLLRYGRLRRLPTTTNYSTVRWARMGRFEKKVGFVQHGDAFDVWDVLKATSTLCSGSGDHFKNHLNENMPIVEFYEEKGLLYSGLSPYMNSRQMIHIQLASEVAPMVINVTTYIHEVRADEKGDPNGLVYKVRAYFDTYTGVKKWALTFAPRHVFSAYTTGLAWPE